MRTTCVCVAVGASLDRELLSACGMSENTTGGDGLAGNCCCAPSSCIARRHGHGALLGRRVGEELDMVAAI